MARNIVQKILNGHLVSGDTSPGREISIRIDQALTQDATGTLTYLQFEAMGIPRVKTRLSVSYVDHNMLQEGPENADDHIYLQSAAARFGIYFSRPGNGICHQVHMERFGVPGQTLLGSDSHTSTCGALGMLAIGAGGLDVAAAMGGLPFQMIMPYIVLVRLRGRLRAWVTAKDIILELLRRLTVKGGVGRIFEYGGEGTQSLSVYERGTIANMGAELGATTSVFPSDDKTKAFLVGQKRGRSYKRIVADKGASYDEIIEVDLNRLEPLIACPHSPDNIKKVSDVEGIRVQQVAIGSCTNSSYQDLMKVSRILKGRKVPADVSLVICPGSRQVLEMIARNGVLSDLVASGARILENGCGPCIGMGQAPPSGAVSVRTFNRNFEGRSGTQDAQVYIASPEVAAASALKGAIYDPRRLGRPIRIYPPRSFVIDDSMIIPPSRRPESVRILRGPNIKPLPVFEPLPDDISGRVLLKVGDNISTDQILPGGANVLPLRSNIPVISEFVYAPVDKEFVRRARDWGGGIIVGGSNYGQGSSREHAALTPRYLGIKMVIASSFARIHRANLINFGIIPLRFVSISDALGIEQGDTIEIKGIRDALKSGGALRVKNLTKGREFRAEHDLLPRERDILLAGGFLNHVTGREDKIH